MHKMKMYCVVAAVAMMMIPVSARSDDSRTASVSATASSFAYPQSVFVDSPGGHIWVADFDNHRMLRFNISTLTAIDRERALAVPQENFLSQNYPNPFNPMTQISFSLARTGYATVTVFDLLGRETVSVFNGIAVGGTIYSLSVDASALPSGIYFYALRSASGNVVKRMCVLK